MEFRGLRRALFSLNSFAAAMLALFVALRTGLPRPYWAVMTVYIVSQPLTGMLRSKGVYRGLGTLLGAMAVVTLVPGLVHAPELLSLALALWVGGCLYLAVLDRTPRSYVFMLAGYSAAVIAFPSVSTPQSIFQTAVLRVEEIGLAIVCATVVHGVLFPQALTPVLIARVDGFLRGAQAWALDALAGLRGEREGGERRQLAGVISELHALATHLPFDTSHLQPRTRAVRALEDRMAMLLPILSGVEDRLSALQEARGALSPQLWTLLEQLRTWIAAGTAASPAEAQRLRSALDALAPPLGARSDWPTLLTASLLVRLRQLVDDVEDCLALRAYLRTPELGTPARLEPLVRARARRPLHRDHPLALLSGFAATVGILLACVLWIATAWPEGGIAAMTVAVYASFFSTQDDPVPAIVSALWFTLASYPVGALYLFAILPRVDGFPMLVAALAPVFLTVGYLMTDPRRAGRAITFILGFVGSLGLQERLNADFADFANVSLAQASGFVFAAVATRFLRSVQAEWRVHRLMRTGWRELAGFSTPGATPDREVWSSRMLDRMGLLMPRLARAPPEEQREAIDALNDLRIGLNIVDLQRARAGVEPQAAGAAGHLLEGVSGYFHALATGRPVRPSAALLDSLDGALRSVAHSPRTPTQERGLLALVGLRRGLFPRAPPYLPPADTEATA